jgi:small subunit ribosomal protein S13
VDLPRDKRVEAALAYIYGIGQTSAKIILAKSGVNPDTRVHALNDDDVTKLRTAIEAEFKVEGALRSEVAMNIKRLIDIGCYRGLRHRRSLPVRGQRTKTNARTRKGPKHGIGVKQKKSPSPTGKS